MHMEALTAGGPGKSTHLLLQSGHLPSVKQVSSAMASVMVFEHAMKPLYHLKPLYPLRY